jgi:hypothetical protein
MLGEIAVAVPCVGGVVETSNQCVRIRKLLIHEVGGDDNRVQIDGLDGWGGNLA